MNVLITGISGYVGSRLAPRLLRDGHAVRGFSRRSGPSPAGVEVVRGDAVSGTGLGEALAGIDVAYYLIHSMEPSADGSFGEREHRAAENFAAAAAGAGVARVIYLGGLVPAGGAASAHLASRSAVEGILRAAVPCTVVLRASIVIGAGSRSFRFLVRLVERMPVLAVPAWHSYRTSPVDERDVVEILARAAGADALCGQTLDVGGRETVSYGELIDRIRDLMLLRRPTISFRRLTLTPIASRVAAVVAGEQHELIGPLMESLSGDLLPGAHRAEEAVGVRLHSLDAAIEHALREWEAVEPLAAR
ncbi:MAG TPA: NAD(P)H-binding protein [Solirubrobacteraceae bacterium]|nr:NAD(P)H-binding protein [Solirubrobacteraceae bacterium]